MVKIAICGEAYSQNLGDGVIADSLSWLLKQTDVGADVCIVDFSGRAGFSTDDSIDAAKPRWIRTIHQSLSGLTFYRKVSILALWYSRKRNSLHSRWRHHLRDC